MENKDQIEFFQQIIGVLECNNDKDEGRNTSSQGPEEILFVDRYTSLSPEIRIH